MARQFADQNPAFVADRFRVDVLVAGGELADGVRVHAALVGEGAGADERLAGAEVHVGDLVDVARQFGEPRQAVRAAALRGRSLRPRLAMTLTRSTLPQRSPMPLIVPCTCVAPAGDGGQRVGDGQVAIVVAMNADLAPSTADRAAATPAAICSGKRAAVGVAQDQHRSPRPIRAACRVCRAYSGLALKPSKKCSAS